MDLAERNVKSMLDAAPPCHVPAGAGEMNRNLQLLAQGYKVLR